MFLSFQNEYPTGNSEVEYLRNVVKVISDFEGSQERQKIIDTKSYFKGHNVFINDYRKMIWSDETQHLVENIYAPNFKTSYNFLGNYASQIVNSLYGETPQIDGLEEKTSKKMGYAGQSATLEALLCGYSFTYEGLNDKFVVFDTENCLAFTDDETDELVRFIRFWHRTIKDKDILFFEIYDDKGITTYRNDGVQTTVFKELQGYKAIIRQSAISKEVDIQNIGKLPIAVHKANKDLESIFTDNVKFKIDLIDLVESGLVNNIEEFSDVWMTINVPSATPEQVQQIKNTARRTKSVILAGTDDKNSVGFQTMEIPYQARQTAVNMLKEELVEDTGVIDFKEIKGTSTATEINARTYKLRQKVSNIEWFADEYFEQLVELWQAYNEKSFDIDITFVKLFINNNTEILNNAVSLYGKVSTKAFLEMLKQANVIDDVESEMKELEKESVNKFDVGDIYADFTSTQGSRQTTEQGTENE